MSGTRVRGGAYLRRGLITPEQADAPAVMPKPVYTGPGWRLYVDATDGQIVVRAGLNEKHLRRVAAHYQALAERGLPVRDGQVHAVGFVLLDPQDQVCQAWGDPVIPGHSRWRALKRFTGFGTVAEPHWTFCSECRDPLWPGRLIAVSRTVPPVGAENDEACTKCLRRREDADPRPSWPYEPPEPALKYWPDYLTTEKRIPLPKGLKKPPKLTIKKTTRRK